MIAVFAAFLIALAAVWYFVQNRSQLNLSKIAAPRFIEGFADTPRDTQRVTELVSDHEQLFKFNGGRFPYLDKFKSRVERELKRLAKHRAEIRDFIRNHQRNVKFLSKMKVSRKLIKPVYSRSDLERNDLKTKKIRDFYGEHLRTYLELAELNNQLLVQQLYCQSRDLKCPQFKRVLSSRLNRYQDLKADFNGKYAEMLDEE